MNLPTNKLRDLIAVLQTIDPDAATEVMAANVFFDDSNKRVVRFALPLSVTAEEVLMELDKQLEPSIDLSLDEGIEGAARDINELYNEVVKHQEKIEKLEDDLSVLQNKYDDLSYRLDNVKEILVSANNFLA